MTAGLRIAVVGLATFAAIGLFAAVVVPIVAGRWAQGPAAQRARRLACLRMLPASLAAALAALVTMSFVAFEPRWTGEDIGVVAPLLAGLSMALILASSWRAVRLSLATRRTIAGWIETAEPVTLAGFPAPAFAVTADFPIVAVVGLRRPRLIIARSVLASCTPEELTAILAHEQGHIDRRDNLRRLLLLAMPDVLSWLPASRRLFDAWRDAAEEAADDDAARCGAEGRVRLASALVKVARLAPPTGRPTLMPASALYRGESLERRVRRLLGGGDPALAPASRRWIARASGALVVAVSLSTLEDVHAFVEGLIHALP